MSRAGRLRDPSARSLGGEADGARGGRSAAHAEQKERIKPIVTANIDELVKLRRQALDILDQMGKQIATELTPEQRTKYEKILEEHRAAGGRRRNCAMPASADGRRRAVSSRRTPPKKGTGT